MRAKSSGANIPFDGNPDIIRHAVWSCCQESAVEFKEYSLFDTGAFPEQPLSGKITMKVTNPWIEQPDEKELDAIGKARALMASAGNQIIMVKVSIMIHYLLLRTKIKQKSEMGGGI